MHAIVSVIDPEHYALVEVLWQELELECGLSGVRATPIPHFSWHVAESYDFDTLQATVKRFAGLSRPFSIHTTGLGLFTRESPVLYFPIVRTSLLSKIHQEIWDGATPLSQKSSPYYAPELWMPHITLAHRDVSLPSLCCGVERLAFQMIAWEIAIDNLAVVSQVEENVGELQFRIQLTG
jgi:2'-5' RNA ligase